METISLLQLIQATSGLAGRNNTQLFIDGQPVTEIRINMKDGKTSVNLVSKNGKKEEDTEQAPDPYPVQCDFDSEHNQWIYKVSIPEKDENALAGICRSNKIEVRDLIQEFIRWIVCDGEAAARWLGQQRKV